MHLLESLRDANVLEESRLFDDLDGLFKIDYALLQHAQFLEAHGHIMISYVRKVSIPLAVIEVNDFQDTLSLLQEHISFFVLVLLYELVRDISQFQQQ